MFLMRYFFGADAARTHLLLKLGDMALFFLFVMLGRSEHGVIDTDAFLRTSIPLMLSWLIISPILGAYRSPVMDDPKAALWRTPLIWLPCGVVGLIVRSLVFDRAFEPAFALVTLGMMAVLLTLYRVVFTLVAPRLMSRS